MADLPAPLVEALHRASADRVVRLLIRVCREHPASRALVQSEFLVPKSIVVPYHADSDSENAKESDEEEENESEEEESAEDKVEAPQDLKRKAQAMWDDVLFPRFAKCENCDMEFDVTLNIRGDCIWHDGEKEVDDNSDTWADHDPDCHGDPYDSDLMNDPTFEDGYMWSCCEKYGGEEGCKQTKHKTAGQPRKKSRHD